MVKEIESFEDAKLRLKTLFGGNETGRLSNENDINDYAKIAWFLTQKSEVKTALEDISKEIWKQYNKPNLKQSANRFSQAIIQCAAQDFGFSVQNNVVFIGPLSGPEFGHYVREGVLWKDTFALDHGEFSHSFQWLAAGKRLSLNARTQYLYSTSGKVFSNMKLKTRGAASDEFIEDTQPLWAWLVDCFPPAGVKNKIQDNDIQHVFSNRSYRIPNSVNELVRDHTSWFIGTYLGHRRDRLKEFAEAGKLQRQEAKETEELDSSLRNITAFQAKAYPSKNTWEKKMSPKNSRGREVTPSGNVLGKSNAENSMKDQKKVMFHNEEGTISMKGYKGALVL